MEKTYERINWEDHPSVDTPINETNLNKMDQAIDELDNRILGLYTAKVDKTTATNMIAELKMKNDAKGENIHIPDSDEAKIVAFGLYGKSEQKQYTGKNLIPYPYYQSSGVSNGIEFVDNGDGSVTANGKASAHTSFIFNHRIDNSLILGAGTYKISGCPSGGSDSTYRLVVGRTSETTGSFEVVVKEYGNGATFTLTKDTDIYIGLEIIVDANISNIVCWPLLRLADITDDTYEPYVGSSPSPNPDYPQEINIAGKSGSVEVKNVGKNLIPYPYNDPSKTQNGITYNVNDDDRTVSVTGKPTNTSFYLHRSRSESDKNPLILQAGTYSISGCPKGGSQKTYYLSVSKTGNAGGNELVVGEYGEGATFTLTEETQMQIGIVVDASYPEITKPLIFKAMIRPVNIGDDTYEQYKENKVTISTPAGLVGIPVNSDGNYTDENGQQWICDEIVKYADGSGKRIQRIGMKIIESSTVIALTNQAENGVCTFSTVSYWMSDRLNSVNAKGMCDKLIFGGNHYNGSQIIASGDGKMCFINSATYNTVYFNTSKATTVQEFHSLFDGMKIYYILAEPIETDLTADEIKVYENLKTFYPVTNVSNNANCGMSITYVADTKNYIDNKFAMLETAIYNNI